MRVKANKQGWYGNVIREKGEEFDIADPSEKGSWMDEVKDDGRDKSDHRQARQDNQKGRSDDHTLHRGGHKKGDQE
jgi:hypothetical protein